MLSNVLYIIARNLVLTDVRQEPKTTVVFINTVQYNNNTRHSNTDDFDMVNQIIVTL